MIRKGLFNNYHSIFLYLFKAGDLSVVIGSALLAEVYFSGWQDDVALFLILLIINLQVYALLARHLDIYASWRMRSAYTEFLLLLSIAVAQTMVLFSLVYVLHFFTLLSLLGGSLLLAWLWIVKWVLLQVALQGIFRLVFRMSLQVSRRKGFNQRAILLVGRTPSALRVAEKIDRHPEYGLQIAGLLDADTDTDPDLYIAGVDSLGSVRHIKQICQEHPVDQVWLTVPMNDVSTVNEVQKQLEYCTVSVRHVLDFSYLYADISSLTNLREVPLLDIDVSPMDGVTSRLIKSFEDKIIAVSVLLILLPLFLIIALGVKLTSSGPVFYRQTRIGWNNVEFEMLKFRTMPVGSDSVSGTNSWSSLHKPKSCWFAAFLRRSSLDELPQFINVLKGDMSIVGPRPERPEFVHKFKGEIPRYMKKHMMKAGITGWAQVNGLRGDTDLRKRIEYDLFYIKNWSPLFDLVIAFQTIYRGFKNKNAY